MDTSIETQMDTLERNRDAGVISDQEMDREMDRLIAEQNETHRERAR